MPKDMPRVTHGETKSEGPPSPPENAEEIRPEQSWAWSLLKDLKQIACHQKPYDPRHDNPTEKSADEPIGLPRPDLDAAERNVEASGCQSTQPVKENTEQRVRYQEVPLLLDNKRTNSDGNQIVRDGVERA